MKNQSLTIENAWICPPIAGEILPLFGDVIINGGVITKIRPKNSQIYFKNPERVNKNSINAGGRVLTLPMVNFHDHIYSRLAKGVPVKGKLDSFQNILHNLWWKLDQALDEDMILACAHMGAVDSIRNGVTYIFDHHSSQKNISGSLDLIKKVFVDFDLRGVLCFETTDRNGGAQAIAGLNENIEFFKDQQTDDFAGMLGLHASFTLSDELLSDARTFLAKNNIGIHIHVAEDYSDILLSKEYTGLTPVRRLVKYKLMNPKSILVHGVHLSSPDFIKISAAEAALAFCLDSNLNNSVGLPQFDEIPKSIPFLIGTDGMHSNIARSTKQLFLLARGQENSVEKSVELVKKIYFDQLTFAKRYFEDFSSLAEGERADMILWDYVPPTPLTRENFWSHYIYGILESPVNTVLQKGIFLMRDFQLPGLNESKIRGEIFMQGERLFNKLK
jgi:cytosine/adenosine deaminase-related metal-dependent hydrolase